ncbi:hypothetical protein CPB84DRAFT_1744571 [Gymnopilus junonius]|uniref:Uncharacterized protein n=1 Tax=Gymnopilus junonius TaxID=109634 RepID=A0A9P5NX93_GYMJU|nr:hypothetical protein CPB84DRAFT_1744571 [Gymnopilus junonius]
MKLCPLRFLDTVVAALFVTTALAIPVKGYRAGDIVVSSRQFTWFKRRPYTARGRIKALPPWKGLGKHLRKFYHIFPDRVTYKETPEQKAERKASLAEKAEKRKEYKKYGKMHAENAKKELKAAGEEYNVKAQFRGPHYAEHGAKAIEEAKKEWHRHTNRSNLSRQMSEIYVEMSRSADRMSGVNDID